MDLNEFDINIYRVLSQSQKDKNLFGVISNPSLSQVNVLLQVGACLEARTFYSNTPLLLATELQHISIVKFLIEKGANLEAKNIEGNTSLLLAIFVNNVELVKLFILSGANLNTENNQKITPFIAALNSKQEIKNCIFGVMSQSDILEQIKNHPENDYYNGFKESIETYGMEVFKKIGVLFVHDSKTEFSCLSNDLKNLIIHKYLRLNDVFCQNFNAELHANALCKAFQKCSITPSYSYHQSRRQRLLHIGGHIKEKIKSKIHDHHANDDEKPEAVKKMAPSD